MSDTDQPEDDGPRRSAESGKAVFVNDRQRAEIYGTLRLRFATAGSFQEVADAAARAAEAAPAMAHLAAFAQALASAFDETGGADEGSPALRAATAAFGRSLKPSELLLLDVPLPQIAALGGGSPTAGVALMLDGLFDLLRAAA